MAATAGLDTVNRRRCLPSDVRRREVLGFAVAAALWPRVARGQQPSIGFLSRGSAAAARPQLAAFWQGLGDAGFAERRNITSEYRWADGRDERLPALAAELVGKGVSVIVACGAQSVAAAKLATATIPVVFVTAADPLRGGLVGSLQRPGGNITGISLAAPELLAKRLQIFHQLAPGLAEVTALVNPDGANIDVQLQYLSDEAKRASVHVQVVNVSGLADLETALAGVAQRRDAGLVVGNDGFLNGERERLVALTARERIAAAFANREFVDAGGLMSYGPSVTEAYQEAGAYAGRILKGEAPANLPVENPLSLELAINAKTAKSLGIDVPPALLATAAEVIR